MNFNVCYSWLPPSLQQSESPALQLTGYCKLTRPTRLTFRTPKRHFLLLKGTMLSYYKEEDEFNRGHAPIQKLNLTGIYIHTVCITQQVHGYTWICMHVYIRANQPETATCICRLPGCSAHVIPYTCMYIYLNL